ncbi:hypothetical protein DVH24_039593 [Malus domestica]|uniref:Uncharacterized protein n=1 Tax=Malus domestica TaxID=3750 RepID=A0A498I5Y8_MALDO|nr:hypothetical protein DVH24_039593 [Malus domestica]
MEVQLKAMKQLCDITSQMGALLYVQVVEANPGMNPELSCPDGWFSISLLFILGHTSPVEKQQSMASLKMVTILTVRLAFQESEVHHLVFRLLSSPRCPVLEELGKKISLEIAIGLNGLGVLLAFYWVLDTWPNLILSWDIFIVADLFSETSLLFENITLSFFLTFRSMLVHHLSTIIIVVSNAIMNSESLTGVKQRIMVDKLIQNLQLSSQSITF